MSISINVFTLGSLLSVVILSHQSDLVAQNYLGIGWHLGIPMKIDNCCNPYVQVKPIPVSTYSLTYKEEMVNKRKKKWYYEIGLTSTGLGFEMVQHENDTNHITPWGISRITHRGFPSVLLGLGRNFRLKNNHEFVMGLEGSFRIFHTMGGIISTPFTLEHDIKDVTFPIFLRANFGYAVPFKLFGQVPSHLLFYTKISAQNIAKGPQYIRNPATGVTNTEGRYTLNNSEVGIQFYIDLGKQHYNFLDRPKKEHKSRAKRNGKSLIKFSLDQQLYSARPSQYYMPQVDSFSLKGHYGGMTTQIGLKAEFVHFRNTDWSTVIMVGTGRITETHRFTASAAFVPGDKAIEKYLFFGPIGRYLIQNVGLSYKHDWGKRKLQQTLTVCMVEPLDYGIEFSQSIRGYENPSILSGEFNEKYSNNKVLFGLEYNPELLFRLDKRVFFGLGMVFNYSWGVMAQGRATVSNGTTTYYGGMLQRFSKIGFTARMGFQGRRHLMDL